MPDPFLRAHWQEIDIVGTKVPIHSGERQSLDLCLSNQHSVEGIPVVPRKIPQCFGMFDAESEACQSACLNGLEKIGRCIKLAQ